MKATTAEKTDNLGTNLIPNKQRRENYNTQATRRPISESLALFHNAFEP